jgi:hypothetical protein
VDIIGHDREQGCEREIGAAIFELGLERDTVIGDVLGCMRIISPRAEELRGGAPCEKTGCDPNTTNGAMPAAATNFLTEFPSNQPTTSSVVQSL